MFTKGVNFESTEVRCSEQKLCGRCKIDENELQDDVCTTARKRNREMIVLRTPRRYKQFRKWVDQLGVLTVKDFEWIEEVGEGQFGTIWKAKIDVLPHDYVVAIKVINKELMRNRGMTLQIERELRIHSALHHENICKCYGFFHNEENLYVALEYCPGGNLYELKNKNVFGHFSESEAANFAVQIAHALRHIHAKGVIHRTYT